MNADTIKLWFVYITALVIIIGGGLFLYSTRAEATAHDLQILIAGFMGAAITFVFNRESATQATRAAQSSTAAGAAASQSGNVTQ